MTKQVVLQSEYPMNVTGSAVMRDISKALNDNCETNGKIRIQVVWCSEDDCDCTGFQHMHDCPHNTPCY